MAEAARPERVRIPVIGTIPIFPPFRHALLRRARPGPPIPDLLPKLPSIGQKMGVT